MFVTVILVRCFSDPLFSLYMYTYTYTYRYNNSHLADTLLTISPIRFRHHETPQFYKSSVSEPKFVLSASSQCPQPQVGQHGKRMVLVTRVWYVLCQGECLCVCVSVCACMGDECMIMYVPCEFHWSEGRHP